VAKSRIAATVDRSRRLCYDAIRREESVMMAEETIEFAVEEAGARLDKLIVARLSGLSRAQVQAMIKDGLVTVDGAQVKAGVKLRGGETIRVTSPPPAAEAEPQAEDITLNVLYEDDDLAVIDKPAGLVVHPGVGNQGGTLVNAILARWPQIAAMDDPDERRGIVHRLDKDTSGLIIVAKDAVALADLMAQFQARTVEKAYLALLERAPRTLTGIIDAPIGRDPRQRKRMAVQRDGREAVTEFTVLDDNFIEERALVEFRPRTGRTHQIRVHAAYIGCPVVGDRVYGFRKQRVKLRRQFLHAARLSFDHPISGERLEFESPLPPGLQNLLDKLRG
jgi:23S rRNA pseudouridine1911/1915/1917 synthase